MSAAEINARVNEIVDSFGLSHVRNTIVGNAVMRGLSGGERRRVSIAVEVCMGTVVAIFAFSGGRLPAPRVHNPASSICARNRDVFFW
jgi:ABC-type Na+ transport system ATPase subunit NatA